MIALLRQFRAQDRVVQMLLINELAIFGSFAMLHRYLTIYFTRNLGVAALDRRRRLVPTVAAAK